MLLNALLIALAPLALAPTAPRDDAAVAREALLKAVRFFRSDVACHGGYLWKYSEDLALREGEGIADAQTVWVQPPGTPAVGMALLEAYERTRIPELLDGAREAGHCLVQGQLRSGGWTYSIRFDPGARERFAYLADASRSGGANASTLDDDTTQAAVRLLLRLDRTLRGRDRSIRESLDAALNALTSVQYPNGAYPQTFSGPPEPSLHPIIPATIPPTWPRAFPNRPYGHFYTINDNLMETMIATLLEAADLRRNRRCREAAVRAGEFLLLAQLPEPQPAWAQQYSFDMHPAWARRFEPPAVTGGESHSAMRALLMLAQATGDRRFLEPIPRAIAYLRRSRLPDGRLARFYELGTNRPLYFTRSYELTCDDSDMPTHYSFTVSDGLDAIERRHDTLLATLQSGRRTPLRFDRDDGKPPMAEEARRIVRALDPRGAWVEDGSLRYHAAGVNVKRIISCETFIRNIRALSRFVAPRTR